MPHINVFINEIQGHLSIVILLGDPEVTANIYCKLRKLPNTDTQNYSTDLWKLLGHPVLLASPCLRASVPDN